MTNMSNTTRPYFFNDCTSKCNLIVGKTKSYGFLFFCDNNLFSCEDETYDSLTAERREVVFSPMLTLKNINPAQKSENLYMWMTGIKDLVSVFTNRAFFIYFPAG